MSEGRAFQGSTGPGGRIERRVTALVGLLLVAFVGVAIVKPWGGQVEPAPSIAPSPAAHTPPAPLPTATPRAPSVVVPADIGPLPVAFTTARPPSGAWTGLRWRRLEPDDPLSLVTSIVRWSHGFVAVGWIARLPATPVWTSADGVRWDPLVSGTASTFWPGLDIIGVAGLRTGLVALTESMQFCGEPCPRRDILPVMSWTSPNGRAWTPNLVSPEWPLTTPGRPPLFAARPGGLILASAGPGARIATSSDGSTWQLRPASAFPARFVLTDLRGTPSGYVAAGRWPSTAGRSRAAVLWSRDGRTWPATPTILPVAPGVGSDFGSSADSLIVGSDSVLAVGQIDATPGATLWWRSPDGRRWVVPAAFSPLGPTTCTGEGCGLQPYGVLVGDGRRLIALRGGSDAAAWVSSDGATWHSLSMTGDLPAENATQATLFPGGVLLTDGPTAWFGDANGSTAPEPGGAAGPGAPSATQPPPL